MQYIDFRKEYRERKRDNEKFLIFANFIADAYEEAGEVRCARIIRKRIDGTYKNDSTVTLD